MKQEPDTGREWCSRCQQDWEDHIPATVDDENHWICPVEEIVVEDEQPQQLLTAFEQE